MKEKIKKIFCSLISNTIYDVLKAILLMILSGTFVSFVSTIIIQISDIQYLKEYKVYFLVFIFVITCFIFLKIYSSKTHLHTYPAIENDYVTLKRIIDFTYGEETSSYRLNCIIKSKKKGLSRFYGKYSWTGSEKPIFKTSDTSNIFHELKRKDSFTEYEIEFPKTFSKGSVINVGVEAILGDKRHTFVPFSLVEYIILLNI